MKSKDKEILTVILGYIAGDDKLEEDIAGELERETGGEVTPKDFHDWVLSYEPK